MAHFFCKLVPPRPLSVADLTEAERELMRQHGEYVRRFFDSGEVIAYGPVMHADGAFGVALVAMEDLAAVERFAAGDPSIVAGMNRMEIAPMMIAGAQAPHSGS